MKIDLLKNRHLCTSALVLALSLGLHATAQARDRVTIGVGLGVGPYWGPRYYYDAPYGYYPPPVYVAPPPVWYGRPVPEPGIYPPPPAALPAPVVNVTLVRVQDALRVRKYYQGSVDGVNGPLTEAAIRAYQTDRNLPVTGKVDGSLLADLGI